MTGDGVDVFILKIAACDFGIYSWGSWNDNNEDLGDAFDRGRKERI